MVLNSQLDSGEGPTDARWAHPAGFLEWTTGCGRRSDQSKTSGTLGAATRCSTSCLLCCARHSAHRAFWAVAPGSGKNRGVCRRKVFIALAEEGEDDLSALCRGGNAKNPWGILCPQRPAYPLLRVSRH